jgi:hypothetical protein
MIVLSLLVACLSIAGCSTPKRVAKRPEIAVCVADEWGGAMCHGPGSEPLKPKLERLSGYVCFSPSDYTIEQEWIAQLIEAAHGF